MHCCNAPSSTRRRNCSATAACIAPGYDAELDELRASQEHADQFLIDLEARERARSGIANLKVGYNRVHGYYIEVTRAQSERVPDDYMPPPNAERRGTLHHAGTEELRRQSPVGTRTGAGTREMSV